MHYDDYYVARWCHGGEGSVSTSSRPLVLFVGSLLPPPRVKALGHPASSFSRHSSWNSLLWTLLDFVELIIIYVCANMNKHVPEL